MSCYRRPFQTGATIFFTVNIADRGQSLLTDQISLLRKSVKEARQDRPFRIDAWVVMPDHMHCVWTLPEGDRAYGQRWGVIKSKFTRYLRRVGFHPTVPSRSKRDKGDAGVWQRRFWEHHIRNEQDYAACVQYCWQNPVKHGFVQDPYEWAFSSIHRDMPRLTPALRKVG